MNKILLKIREYTDEFMTIMEVLYYLIILGILSLIEIWNYLKESIGL